MQLKQLTLTQVRLFEQAKFDFQPGMNLLVGINGAGKSTVLDVLRIMLSQALPKFTASRSKPIAFADSDITVGQGALTVELNFEAEGISFEHLMHVPHEQYVADKDKEGEVHGQTYDLEKRNDLKPGGKELPRGLKSSAEQPLAIYFSTGRSLPKMRAPSKQSSAGGQTAAFADALTHRELRLREFAEWWLVQETLADETGNASLGRRLDVLKGAVTSFLDGCTNLRAVREPKTTLLIDKDNATLDVRQLSDGERGMVALVLDLARRLAQANPQLPDPLRDGKAVVLIDELDLHLHPRWQRTIAQQLTATFPNCQFIATTHSPQIVGEISPDNIILLESGKAYPAHQSLGMDSNWILRYLMGADERDVEIKQELREIEELIENERYDEATAAIDALRVRLGEFSALIDLQTRIDMIQFFDDDEEDSEKSG